MGGALAYKTYQMQGGRFWDGLLLVSPTLSFPTRLRPPEWLGRVLRWMEGRLGTTPLVPWSKLYLDLLTEPVTRQEVGGWVGGWVV